MLTPATSYTIDIILNALHSDAAQVQRCLQALQAHTPGYIRLLLCHATESAPPLAPAPPGWTVHLLPVAQSSQALTQALSLAQQPWLVYLHADLLVTPDWLANLLDCAKADEHIAFVGAWGNRLGAQSLNSPENPHLPLDFIPAQMAWRMQRSQPHLQPRLPWLHPDALLIRRSLILAFPPDAQLATPAQQLRDCQQRAAQSGWQARLADAAYVYRTAPEAEPLSYQAAEMQQECTDNRVLAALRRHHQNLLRRWHRVSLGDYYWHERRVLIVLPLHESSGGTHVLVSEASAMRRMKVEVEFLNFHAYRAGWEASYPHLEVPTRYVSGPEAVVAACAGFDAVIATAYFTVDWLLPLKDMPQAPRLGYYVQDFEPYFFIEKITAKLPGFWRSAWIRRRIAGWFFRRHAEFRRAWLSYLPFPNMQLFTKTPWNQHEIKVQTGHDSLLIGPSYQSDLFLPRTPHTDDGRVRIVAMIRPSTLRRSPLLTMRVLRRIQHQYGGRVDISIFGALPDDPAFLALPRDFVFQRHAHLPSPHVADVLSWADIFVDFSQFQAMGLTGLEAMACGAAVILPQTGGADTFAQHGKNALVINSHSESACVAALRQLIEDPALRRQLATQAQQDVLQYSPEAAAFRVLDGLFGHELESW